jgi:hypothetical protein
LRDGRDRQVPMKRPALRRGTAGWREAIGAACVAAAVVLAARWLVEPAPIVDAIIGVATYAIALLALIGRRDPSRG